jgi:hypothetical protein
MRDFKAGHDIHIEGDVHIDDRSNQPKFLAQCTNEELHAELAYRKQLLSRERTRKLKICSVLCGCAEAAICGVALWYYLQGNINLSFLIFGLGSMFAGAVSLQYVGGRNEVQQAHVNAILEIKLTLRERGAK